MIIIHGRNSNISLSSPLCVCLRLFIIKCRTFFEVTNSKSLLSPKHWLAFTRSFSLVFILSLSGVCAVNVSNQIFRYDSERCKLLVHGINKMPTVERERLRTKEKEKRIYRTEPFPIHKTDKLKQQKDKRPTEKSDVEVRETGEGVSGQTVWEQVNKTVDDALNKLLKLTEN